MTPDRDQLAELRQVVAVCGELSGLVATDCGLDQVLGVVTDRLGVAAAVVDETLGVLAAAGAARSGGADLAPDLLGAGAEVAHLVETAGALRRAVSLPAVGGDAVSWVVAPVLVGGEPAAYVLTGALDVDESGEDGRVMVTTHAAMVCGVVLTRQRVLAIATGRARRDLFDGLLLVGDRTAADVEGWARHLGLDPGLRHRVLVAVLHGPDGVAPDAATATVEHVLGTRCPTAAVVNRGDEVVLLASAGDGTPSSVTSPSSLAALVRLCRTAVTHRFPDVELVAGIGDAHTGAAEISTSYTEARRAAETARLLPGLDGVAVFADLGLQRLFALVRSPAELQAFARDVLGALLDHDERNDTELCATLGVYFAQNGSPRRTGELLHMHANTVSYRLRRAEEITGLDLASSSDRLMAQVALEIVDGLGGTA